MKTSTKHLFRIFRKITVVGIGIAFLLNTALPVYGTAYAQSVSTLPLPGTQVSLSPVFNPLLLKAVKVQPNNPFQFEFIIDQGDTIFSDEEFKVQSQRLIRYFLASLTIPENDLWVNLSPYEKDRIIPESFGVTEMGRDLLAQDYLLKQITATLMYPEGELGKKFWDKVHKQAFEKFGTTEIPTNTFNKVWIVPQKAVVYENGPTAYVDETKLKVMLEEDYVALSNQKDSAESRATARDVAIKSAESFAPAKDVAKKDTSSLASQIIREIILPELEKEVNTGTHFAALRQVYNSLILANWYKKRMKDSILSRVYTDKNKTSGVEIDDKTEAKKIYARYVEAFQKGVYNYIKEDFDPVNEESIPRKYFSGGVNMVGMGMVGSSAVLNIISDRLPAEMPVNPEKIKAAVVTLKPYRDPAVVAQVFPANDDWARFSKVTEEKMLFKRLMYIERMITIEGGNVEMIVPSLQGKAAQMQTITLDANPLDLLKEVSFYLSDLQSQIAAARPNLIYPAEYSKAWQVLAQLLAVSLPWYQLSTREVTQGLSNVKARQLQKFMEGTNQELDSATLRQVIGTIEKLGEVAQGPVVISFRAALLKESRLENNQKIVATIKLQENKAQRKLQPLLEPLGRQRLMLIARGQIFTRDAIFFDRILAPLRVTWDEVLTDDFELYSALEREGRIEDAIAGDLKILGETLVRLRGTKEGASIAAVAQAAVISPEIYEQYEAGLIRSINPKHILGFSKFFAVDPNELWPANDLVEIKLNVQERLSAAPKIVSSAVAVNEINEFSQEATPQNRLPSHRLINDAIARELPQDFKDFSSFDPGLQAKVKDRYRDTDGQIVIPINGLLRTTGLIGHIGIGSYYGEPVIYMDARLKFLPYYKSRKMVVDQLKFKITKWEEQREKLGLKPEEMRQWIQDHSNSRGTGEAQTLENEWQNEAPLIAEVFQDEQISFQLQQGRLERIIQGLHETALQNRAEIQKQFEELMDLPIVNFDLPIAEVFQQYDRIVSNEPVQTPSGIVDRVGILLSLAENLSDSQLAWVIGHEWVHAQVGRYSRDVPISARSMNKRDMIALLENIYDREIDALDVIDFQPYQPLGQVYKEQMVLDSIPGVRADIEEASQLEEKAADLISLLLITRGGMDPQAAVSGFIKTMRLSGSLRGLLPRSRLLKFASHPEDSQRLKYINDYISEQNLQASADIYQNDVITGALASSTPGTDKVGGINLSADKINLEIRGNGAPVELNFDPQQIDSMKIDGFVPVIINVKPVTNLPLFLTENTTRSPASPVSQVN
jgi:hypothetical protein